MHYEAFMRHSQAPAIKKTAKAVTLKKFSLHKFLLMIFSILNYIGGK